MTGPFLYTKLQQPAVTPDILPRARLLEQLDKGRQRTLTLISAPAGYGKSTLASRWAASCECPSGWVSLEESDSDMHMFLSYVLTAVRSLFPTADLQTEVLLEATSLPPASDLARLLLNDLHQISESFILILDDYHHIQIGSPVNDLLSEILARPPQNMHLVLLTRHDPSLPIASMRGGGEVTEIRAADLRFTPNEAAVFLSRMLDVVVDETAVTLLEAKIEGWAAGLRLAGLYLQGQQDLKQSLEQLNGSSTFIAEYLFAEVLSRQHPEMAAYLLESSILNRFCAPLCQQMHQTGNHRHKEKAGIETEQFIRWLKDANLFVVNLDSEGHWLRYHHLFHEFLKDSLLKQYTQDRIDALHRVASRWFKENGSIEEAVEHLLTIGDISAAIELTLDSRHTLMNNSEYSRLHRLLARLPEDALADAPLLTSTQAFIGIDQGKDAEVYAFTQKAIDMLAAIAPESEAYYLVKGEVLMLQGLVDLITGDAETALARVQEASEHIPDNALMIRTLGVGTIALCHQMMGNRQMAVAVIEEALSDSAWPVNLRARLHFYLTIILYVDGDLPGSMAAARECLRTIRNYSFVHTRTFVDYFLGAAQYLQNHIEAAQSSLLKVVADRQAANPSYVAYAGFILAHIYLEQGDEAAADRLLYEIGAFCKDNDHITVLSITRAFDAEFALHRGDTAGARRISQHAEFDAREPLWFFYTPQLTPIKLLLASGSRDDLLEAQNRLIQWEERMRLINRKSILIEVLALLALVCRKLGDETAARQNLQSAMDLAEKGNWIRTFVDMGMEMIDLLRCLIQQKSGHIFAQRVLEACQVENRNKASVELNAANEPPVPEPSPQTVITRREIDILRLLADGLSNKQIAARLYIAPLTVKTHLQNIYKKLNAKNRIEALNRSRENGIIADQ